MKRKKFKRTIAVCSVLMLFLGMTVRSEATNSVSGENSEVNKISVLDYNDDGITSVEELTILRNALVNGDTDDKYDITVDGTVNVLELVRLKKIVADLTEQWSEFY